MWPSFGKWREQPSAPHVSPDLPDSTASGRCRVRLDELRARLLSNGWDAEYEVARAAENLTERARKVMRLDAMQAAGVVAGRELSCFVQAVADVVTSETAGASQALATSDVVVLLGGVCDEMILNVQQRDFSPSNALSERLLDAVTPMEKFRQRLVVAARGRLEWLVEEGSARVEYAAIALLTARARR